MITDALLAFLLIFPHMLVSSLDTISSIVIPQYTFNWWFEVFYTLNYIFPVSTVMGIFLISFVIKTFQITWSLLLRVKSFVPTMGA